MSSLSNLYISQSWQGLLHFATNQSSSATLGLIEDGTGNSLGLYLNTNGDLKTTTSISSSLIQATKLVVKNKIELTGSVDVLGSVTASNAFITNDLIVSGTIYAYKINTTIESSSVIFSSGSNILGDSTADTQTLNGTIIMSGSSQLTGSMGISANLNVLGNISSSTLSGVGNVTLYSQSVDYRLDNLEAYSGSAENKFAAIQTYTSSMNVYTASVNNQLLTLQQFTASVGLVTTASYNAYTTSTNARLNSIEIATSSLQIFSASAKIELANLELTTASLNSSISQLNASSASQQISINSLNAVSTSLATTGSNTFVGSQVFSGSMRGVIIPLTITSLTASMDCSLGNFFSLSLPGGGVNTRLVATNIQPGETINLKVLTNSTTSSISYPSYFKFPAGNLYSASLASNAVDIVSLISYDTSTLYGVNVKNMI